MTDRTVVQRIGEIDAEQRGLEAGDADAQSHYDIRLQARRTAVVECLTTIRENRDAGTEDLQQLAAQKETLLDVHEDALPAFEREVGIGAQPVLPVRDELHIAIELPSPVDANAGAERLRLAPLEA